MLYQDAEQEQLWFCDSCAGGGTRLPSQFVHEEHCPFVYENDRRPANVEVIEIDADAKYMLFASGMTLSELERMAKRVKEWWAGDEKFCIVWTRGKTQVTLERMDRQSVELP